MQIVVVSIVDYITKISLGRPMTTPSLTHTGIKTSTQILKVNSQDAPDFVDITEEVFECINQSNINFGFVVVFSKHTTAGITIQENEPLLLEDMKRLLEKIAPKDDPYKHNDFSVRTVHMHDDECPNGHSHCQQLMIGSSETIPIIDAKLSLGKWQRIFMVELDDGRREFNREITVQILGV